MTRIGDLCHTHVFHKWLYHLDACAGIALAPHDNITKVQKNSATGPSWALVNAVYVDHSWTLNSSMVKLTASLKPPKDRTLVSAPFWEHHNLLIRGLTAETSGLTSNPGQMISSPPLLSGEAARLWTCVWHSPTQQQPDGERSTSSILIVKTHITDDKFQTFGLRQSPSGLDCRRPTIPSRYPNTAFCRRHWSVPQRSAKVSQIPPAQVEARNSNSLRRTAAMTRAVRPHSSAREGFSADSWTELWVIGFGLLRLMGGTTTKTQTEEQTPQYQMTTARTFFPSPVHKPKPSRSQTCALLGAVCSLMYHLFLELEALFEDHGVCSGVITDSLVLERAV